MLSPVRALLARFRGSLAPPQPGGPSQAASSKAPVDDVSSQVTQRLALLLSGFSQAILVLDGSGTIVLANDSAAALLSTGSARLTGMAFGWALPVESAIDALRETQHNGLPQSRMIELSERRHVRLDVAPIEDDSNWKVLASLTDLTELFRTDQVRRDFVANVSHELRTPLASIKAVIETLESGGLQDAAAARDFLSRANDEIDRLTQLVEELLELSRIESGVPLSLSQVDLSAVVARAVERLRPQAEQRGVRLDANIAPASHVRGDAERLERATVNLVQNAINFTSEGGSVNVESRSDEGFVEVCVIDSGIGIGADDQPRVFERFFKVDRARGARGTGLGLAIVKHTIEAHGGTVHLDSRLGHGSTFSFKLPVAE